MARGNRQRAKQRQAERRARRLEEGEEERIELEVNAPPEDLGTSAKTVDTEQDQYEAEADLDSSPDEEPEDEELEDYDFEDEEQPYDEGGEPPTRGPRGVRGGDAEGDGGGGGAAGEKAEGKHRGRVLTFLANSWAELQRVQWPNRQQVISLTGVVLGFVLIAGGYLGALDALFSRIIESII
ncbi:MAG: preprotein translocase subunit SecE [Thermoleophilaceae bacterium]|nr:preprotein translocase subunit SecE [Thermoleophilaceae bacterium]